jgi:hypothetical protein
MIQVRHCPAVGSTDAFEGLSAAERDTADERATIARASFRHFMMRLL